MNNKFKALLVSVLLATGLAGCSDADVASHNLSKAADNFQIERRIVFYNGITGEYILTIQGLCSVSSFSGQLSVTCKTGSNEFKKHYLGLSDNVTYFSEQTRYASVSTSQYKIVFKPSIIIPSVEIR
jgi:hypothetical protein